MQNLIRSGVGKLCWFDYKCHASFAQNERRPNEHDENPSKAHCCIDRSVKCEHGRLKAY